MRDDELPRPFARSRPARRKDRNGEDTFRVHIACAVAWRSIVIARMRLR